MVIYLDLDEGKYVIGYGSDDGDVEIDLPKDHDFFYSEIRAWKYENDELYFDKERNEELTAEREKEESKLTPEEMNEMAIMELAMIISEMKGGN